MIMLFCNINFNILKKDQLFERNENETKCIATVNAQFIVLANKNERYMNYINNNYSTFDGEIPLKNAKRFNRFFANVEKLPGSEIIYDFCDYAKKNNLSIFLLGGYKDSNLSAIKKIAEIYKVKIDGYSPDYENYPFSEIFTNDCISRINYFKPDILFVGFGAPKQEYFIEDNVNIFNKIKIKYVIGCGGTFEFVSGKIQRAPIWIQKVGIESLFRLINEISWARIHRILYSFNFYKYIKSKPDWVK